jgi:hypothetical protein
MLTKKIISALMLSLLAVTVFASEVYIEQAGTGSTIDVTQTGASNTVNGATGTTDAAVLSGNAQTIAITQTGDSNEAVVNITGASAAMTYTATGSYNTYNIMVNGGSGNTATVDVTGDYNHVSICGANDGATSSTSGSTVAGPSCSSGISANDVTNIVTVTGDANIVNAQVGSLADTENTVTIGANATSDNNIVDITQTNAGVNTVNVSIDGSTNNVTILQN